MSELSERLARLIARIDERAIVVECPVCRRNEWDYTLDTGAIPKMAPNPERAGLEVVGYICRHCGYVRFHSTNHVERQDPNWDFR